MRAFAATGLAELVQPIMMEEPVFDPLMDVIVRDYDIHSLETRNPQVLFFTFTSDFSYFQNYGQDGGIDLNLHDVLERDGGCWLVCSIHTLPSGMKTTSLDAHCSIKPGLQDRRSLHNVQKTPFNNLLAKRMLWFP